MGPNISIRPSKDIRTNYAQISALTRENPVAITVNGKEDTVLLSHEDFRIICIILTSWKQSLQYMRILPKQWMISSLAGLSPQTLYLQTFWVIWRVWMYEQLPNRIH